MNDKTLGLQDAHTSEHSNETREVLDMDEYDPLLAAYNNGNGDQTGKYICAFIWDWQTWPRRCYQCGELEGDHQ